MSTYALLMAKATQKYFSKNSMALKPQIFSPANLSPSTVSSPVIQVNLPSHKN